RKRALRRIVPRRPGAVRYVDHVRGRGVDLFRAVCELDLEGIVAKPAASAYRVNGSRPPWGKIKNSSYTRAEGRFERVERAARRRARWRALSYEIPYSTCLPDLPSAQVPAAVRIAPHNSMTRRAFRPLRPPLRRDATRRARRGGCVCPDPRSAGP